MIVSFKGLLNVSPLVADTAEEIKERLARAIQKEFCNSNVALPVVEICKPEKDKENERQITTASKIL